MEQTIFSGAFDNQNKIINKVIDLKDKKLGMYFVTKQSGAKFTTKKFTLN